jgi:hypothetical protein
MDLDALRAAMPADSPATTVSSPPTQAAAGSSSSASGPASQPARVSVPTSPPPTPPNPSGAAIVVPLCRVTTPTGGAIEVMGTDEEARYQQSLLKYTDGVVYTERSDFEDLERLLFYELMVYRWGRWMMSGREYDGTLITNQNDMRRMVQDYTDRIAKIKENLKLDRKSREGDTGMTFNERYQRLAEHAGKFGIMRNKQSAKAIELMQQIFAIIRAFDRADEEERRKMEMPNEAAVLQLVRDVMPDFDAVDAHFRANDQSMWIRTP